MAQLPDNGLYTIEYGSSAWRSILNTNVAKTITETKLKNGITTDINQTGNYNLNGNFTLNGNLTVTGTILTVGTITAQNDVKFIDDTKGVLLKDRHSNNFYKLYIGKDSLYTERLFALDIIQYHTAIALYKFADNADDVSGNHNGSATDITYDTGYLGRCAVFNGSSSKIESTNFDINSYNGVTISFWMRTTTTSSGSIMGFSGGNTMAIKTTDGTTCRVYFSSNDNHSDVSNFFINDGTWHFYAFVINGSETKHYRDDALVTTTDQAKATVTTTFSMGNVTDNNGDDDYFDGSLDQVRVFNTAFTEDYKITTNIHYEEAII